MQMSKKIWKQSRAQQVTMKAIFWLIKYSQEQYLSLSSTSPDGAKGFEKVSAETNKAKQLSNIA